VRRRIFAWQQSWEVDGDLGAFLIKKKLFSYSRKMYVEGGQYDGATISGDIFDLCFSVAKADGTVLGRAAGKKLAIRNRHNVELVSEDLDDVTFTATAMVVLQLARKWHEPKEKWVQGKVTPHSSRK
jgi:uncharacterized protein YxjI